MSSPMLGYSRLMVTVAFATLATRLSTVYVSSPASSAAWLMADCLLPISSTRPWFTASPPR